jgi:hypothetical protein
METEARVGMVFEATLEEFFEGGRPYRRQGTTSCCGMNFEVPIFSKSVQLYRLWHGFQGKFVGDCFCAVSGFSLGWKSVIVVVMYFPEAE